MAHTAPIDPIAPIDHAAPDPSPASDPTPSPDPSPVPDPKPKTEPRGPTPVPGIIPPEPGPAPPDSIDSLSWAALQRPRGAAWAPSSPQTRSRAACDEASSRGGELAGAARPTTLGRSAPWHHRSGSSGTVADRTKPPGFDEATRPTRIGPKRDEAERSGPPWLPLEQHPCRIRPRIRGRCGFRRAGGGDGRPRAAAAA
jgi:hypothetical protein